MTGACILVPALLLSQILLPLPLDETIKLDPQPVLDDTTSMLVSMSDLAFTAESVTRRVSILGWASERYDIEVGEVLSGSMDMDMVSAYVYPEGLYSHQFAIIADGCGLLVLAMPDNAHDVMEGFSTSEGDWSMWLIPVAPE